VSVHSQVRTAGSRVYVDLGELEAVPLAGQTPSADAVAQERIAKDAAADRDYRATVAPVAAKLAGMEPFVLSAAASPQPDVLAALEGSLQGLERWVGAVKAPSSWRHTHDALVQASGRTRQAMDAEFTGNRVEQARNAFALLAAIEQALGN
jgi:hypothetical protein